MSEDRRLDLAGRRAAFERWITAPPFERNVARCGAEDAWPGQYRDYAVQLAYEAWILGARDDARLLAAAATKRAGEDVH